MICVAVGPHAARLTMIEHYHFQAGPNECVAHPIKAQCIACFAQNPLGPALLVGSNICSKLRHWQQQQIAV